MINKEILYHLQCEYCKAYFSKSDTIKYPPMYYCPNCGILQNFENKITYGQGI